MNMLIFMPERVDKLSKKCILRGETAPFTSEQVTMPAGIGLPPTSPYIRASREPGPERAERAWRKDQHEKGRLPSGSSELHHQESGAHKGEESFTVHEVLRPEATGAGCTGSQLRGRHGHVLQLQKWHRRRQAALRPMNIMEADVPQCEAMSPQFSEGKRCWADGHSRLR